MNRVANGSLQARTNEDKMSNEIKLLLDLIDFDRDNSFPISSLFLWAQKCRVQIYNSGLLLELRNTTGPLMVKAQTFEFLGERPLPFLPITVSQSIANVGKTSLSLGITFRDDQERIFARGCVVMVCVREGQAREIPQAVRDELVKQISHEASSIKASLDASVSDIKAKLTTARHVDARDHHVLLRYSDEDANRHVRHLRYAQFFEDSLRESGVLGDEEVYSLPLTLMSVEYIKETRGGEECKVTVDGCKTSTSPGAYNFIMKRNEGDQVVCRGLARF